jgi:flagellar biosynthesis/type III secretory pathway M-ring protein FliF/YscJ
VLVKFQPQIEEGARVGGLLLVALLAFLFVVRPLMQKVTGSQLAVASVGAQAMPELPSSPRPMTVAELQALEEARLIEGEQVKLSESVRAKALLKRTTEAAQQQPQHLAKVIQTMIADAGR